MSLRREFYEGKEGGNKTEGKADWRLLIARPPAGARDVWGKERLQWHWWWGYGIR